MATTISIVKSVIGPTRCSGVGVVLLGVWLGVLAGCAVNPTPVSNPLVANAGDDRIAGAGDTLSLSASASGGNAPYVFRWNVEVVPDGQPIETVLDGVQAEIMTPVLVEGRYVYRVLVTDADGMTDHDFVEIVVGAGLGVTIVRELGDDGTPIAPVVNETVKLTAEVNREGTFEFAWSAVSGVDAAISDPSGSSTDITPTEPGDVVIRVDVTDGDGTTAGDQISLTVLEGDRPRVVMTVASDNVGVTGEIVFELFADLAPKTVDNLLAYIDASFYDGVVWHRVARNPDGEPFVVQMGGFTRGADGLVTKDPIFDPVESEADNGVSNLPMTIAMALRGGDSGSGTSQVFVNLADNSHLDPDFTVFGRVVEGGDIIEAMSMVETGTVNVDGGGLLADVPTSDITIVSFRRAVPLVTNQ